MSNKKSNVVLRSFAVLIILMGFFTTGITTAFASSNWFIDQVNEYYDDSEITESQATRYVFRGEMARMNSLLYNENPDVDYTQYLSSYRDGTVTRRADSIENQYAFNVAKKVYIGYPDRYLRMGNYITRAEFSQVVRELHRTRLITLTSNGQVYSFSDVSQRDWFYTPVMMAAKSGIMVGRGAQFDPYGRVTVGELLSIYLRTFNYGDDGLEKVAKAAKEVFGVDLGTPKGKSDSDLSIKGLPREVKVGESVEFSIKNDDGEELKYTVLEFSLSSKNRATIETREDDRDLSAKEFRLTGKSVGYVTVKVENLDTGAKVEKEIRIIEGTSKLNIEGLPSKIESGKEYYFTVEDQDGKLVDFSDLEFTLDPEGLIKVTKSGREICLEAKKVAKDTKVEITVTLKGNKKVEATKKVTILGSEDATDVDKVTLDAKSITVKVGESKSVSVTTSPDKNVAVEIYTDHSSIARYSNGKVYGIAEGNTTLRAVYVNSAGKRIEAQCAVEVKASNITNPDLPEIPDEPEAPIRPTNPTTSEVSWRITTGQATYDVEDGKSGIEIPVNILALTNSYEEKDEISESTLEKYLSHKGLTKTTRLSKYDGFYYSFFLEVPSKPGEYTIKIAENKGVWDSCEINVTVTGS